jgi:hypothetical protein
MTATGDDFRLRLWDVFFGSTWVGRVEREDGETALNAMARMYPEALIDRPELWRVVQCFPNRLDATMVPPSGRVAI